MSRTDADRVPLLESTDEITAEWVQQVLAAAGVTAPQIDSLATRAIGHGNMGTTVAISLTYAGDAGTAPRSLVAKFASKLPIATQVAAAAAVYEREVKTYRLLGDPPPLSVPRLLLAEASDDGRLLNLVMEDLSTVAEPGDQVAGCSPADALAAITEFASLHARFWNAPELGALDWLYNNPPRSAEAAAQSYEMTAQVATNRFKGRLPDQVFEAIRSFAPRMRDWAGRAPVRTTLIHREARVDNVMFDRRDASGPKAYVIDWQFTSCGDPQWDVAYFASGSLSIGDRRGCERDLVAAHAARIRETDPGYSNDEAMESYRFYLPSGLVTTLSAALVLPPGEHEDLLLMTLLERNVAAMRDWGIV